MSSVFNVEKLVKSYNGIEVLKEISLSVNKGEVVAIIGPSGSGKTTFLRCATLLEDMDAGKLSFGDITAVDKLEKGSKISTENLKAARKCFGMVFQQFNLFPHFSVLKNITDAPIVVEKRNKEEVEKEALQLLDQMNLSDKANAYPCELSGGQQQRVAIARALALKPEILFFDEPTSALDPELTKEVYKVIRDLASKNMTMVIVTHDIDFARAVADKVVFMADGYIVEAGPANLVIDNPACERTKAFLAGLKTI
jgi:polar amino acid transport system ATP-binding protein